MTASINQTENGFHVCKTTSICDIIYKNVCNCEQPPVVDYPVDNHPLWFNAITVEALLHHSVLGVFAFPLLTVELLLSGAIVIRWRFIHVVLTLVVPIHDRVIQLQLHRHRQNKTINSASFHSPPPLAKSLFLQDCNI